MKRFYKLLACCLVLALSVGMLITTSFAARDDDVKVTRVTLNRTTITLRVNQTVELEAKLYPRDAEQDDVDWTTSNYDVADVDDWGLVTANGAGTCTIRAKAASGKYADCTVTVTDSNTSKDNSATTDTSDQVDTNHTTTANNNTAAANAASSSSGSSSTSTKVTGDVTAATVTSAIGSASNGYANIRGGSAITTDVLKSAAQAAPNVKLQFDTLNSAGNGVEGRLTLDPSQMANLSGTISLGVHSSDTAVSSVRNLFTKNFRNDITVIKVDHNGSFGTNVTFAAKASLPGNDVKIYYYDSTTNVYNPLEGATYKTDSNGYIHITANRGGYIILSNGDLTRK